MEDQVEEVTNLLNYVDDKFMQLMELARKVIAEHGADTWAVVETMIRLKHIAFMLPAFLITLLLLWLAIYTWRVHKEWKKNNEGLQQYDKNRKEADVPFFFSIFSCVALIALSLATWLNVWNLAILYDPKIYIIREAFNKVME